MGRALLLVVGVAAGLAATASAPERAWACSCAGEPPEALLARSEAAFVGTFLEKRLLGGTVPFSARSTRNR